MIESAPVKVLMSAFAVSPVRGSEYSVGWEWIKAIAARHSVWVISAGSERHEVEAYIRDHPAELANVSFHFLPWHEPSYSGVLLHVVRRYLIIRWEWRCYVLARELNSQVDFDILDHVNGTGFREPGFLWMLNKPFVWGPVCGLQFFSLGLLDAVPVRARLFYAVRNLTTIWAMYVSPRPRRAATRAAAILAGSSNVAAKIRSLWGRDATVCCEVSAPDLEPGLPVCRAPDEPLRIVWSGRCQGAKALNIVLLALAELKQAPVDWRLIVVGDGPLWAGWKALAEDLGIGGRCDFVGRLSREETLDVMATGHCFVQPSLYDATSSVVVEALAHGLPVVCLDHFGFSDAVSEDCGIKVAPKSVPQVVRGFAKAIEILWLDEEARYAMAIGARKASFRFRWKFKEGVIDDVYRRVLLHGGADAVQSANKNKTLPHSVTEQI